MNTATQITTTVIYHSADFDGIFCREIAKKFLGDGPEIQFIGWDFGDAPLDTNLLHSSKLVIMDLPVDRVFGLQFRDGWICKGEEQVQPIDRWDSGNNTWIDHHASSIATHPASIPGYRIDGVSACRLAWQWFDRGYGYSNNTGTCAPLPGKQGFIDREVAEPMAVRLAGEYDIWDKRDPDAEVFQFGLRSTELDAGAWNYLLNSEADSGVFVQALLRDGQKLQRYQRDVDAGVVNGRSFMVEFEGLKFLALNTARCNSLTFAARDITETGHDALMGFFFDGKAWKFSLYHARNLTDFDLSAIAVKYGGGGHRGACGFQVEGVNRICILNGKLDIH